MTVRRQVEDFILHHGTFAEALFALAFARLAVLLFFRRVSRWALDRHTGPILDSHPHLERRISAAIQRASRFFPGERVCLPNAIAAKAMLARRGIASTIHLGVGRHPSGALHAHAWLECAHQIVTGEGQMHNVTHLPR